MVEFDLIINQQIPGEYINLLHMTTGEDHGTLGTRIPAIWLIDDKIYCMYDVNGDNNYFKIFYYELNQHYHFEISQQYNSDGEAIYRITINGDALGSIHI